MASETVFSADAPQPIGPYSQAVAANGFLFLSGQVAIDPTTGAMIAGGVEEQAHRVFQNIGAVLRAAGLDFSSVIKATVFLADMADFSKVNGVYGQYLGEPFPARSAVAAAGLPLGARIEIEVIARLLG